MPKVRSLSPAQAKRSLANKLAPLADRLRQLNTNFGIRPYRVFLTWTRFGGEERGEGHEKMFARAEILPTPKVSSLDAVSFSIFHAGTLPVGSIRVEEVSAAAFTEDMLRGLKVPDGSYLDPDEQKIPEPYDFFYEVVEDGRGDGEPARDRYRLLSKPFRRAGKVDWTLMLERVSPDRTRDDQSVFGILGSR